MTPSLKSYCFIYNPAANPGSSAKTFERVIALTAGWQDTHFLTSSEKGDIESLAREAADTFDVVVACGGDGTVREVATGLLDRDVAMGIIPMGSGNDFSKSLNLPDSLEDTVRVLKNGNLRQIDVGRCNDHYFLNTFGFGFDGLASYYALRSRLSGNWKYAWSALKANWNLEPLQASVSASADLRKRSPARSLLMITLANGRIEGGRFIVAPDARIDDRLLDILTVRPVSKWLLPFLLPVFVFGWQESLPYVDIFKVKTLSIELDRPTWLHADGESIESEETEFEVKLIPSALTIVGNF